MTDVVIEGNTSHTACVKFEILDIRYVWYNLSEVF